MAHHDGGRPRSEFVVTKISDPAAQRERRVTQCTERPRTL